MRHLILLVSFCMLLWVTSSAAINQKRLLINRPSTKEIFQLNRNRRSGYDYGVKGRLPTNKKRSGEQPLELTLRKGEYICGNRVCKLQPGEIPKGCHGICQYPV